MKRSSLFLGIFVLTLLAAFSRPARAVLFFADETMESVQAKISDLSAEGHRTKKSVLYSQLGGLLYRQGRMAEASQAYETALTFSPGRTLKRHIYLYMGKSYESSNRIDKAQEAYKLAVTYDRKNWRRHRDLGQIDEQLLLYSQAVESYRSAIKYNPKSSSVHLSLGRTFRKMGLYEEAEGALNKAQDLGNDSAALFTEFSLMYEGTGRFGAAAGSQRRAISSSSSASDWGRLIYLAALAGDRQLANEGLSNLRKKETLPDTVSFYEELVDLLGRKPESRLNAALVDPTLRSLIGAVRTSSANPQ